MMSSTSVKVIDDLQCNRVASGDVLDLSMPLSSETLPDDDREARAAQSQQEQGQVSIPQ